LYKLSTKTWCWNVSTMQSKELTVSNRLARSDCNNYWHVTENTRWHWYGLLVKGFHYRSAIKFTERSCVHCPRYAKGTDCCKWLLRAWNTLSLSIILRGHIDHSLWTYWPRWVCHQLSPSVLCFVQLLHHWVKQRCCSVHVYTSVSFIR